MKKYLLSFLAGSLTTALALGLIIPAFANTITTRTTLEVDPINIMVNGEVFAPKDVNGDSVAVFAYNGTTYAPLRALAEAYGLEVGYDQEKNLATVNNTATQPSQKTEDTTAPQLPEISEVEKGATLTYQEFKDMWDVHMLAHVQDDPEYGTGSSYRADYRGELSFSELQDTLKDIKPVFERYALELLQEQSDVVEEAKYLFFFCTYTTSDNRPAVSMVGEIESRHYGERIKSGVYQQS